MELLLLYVGLALGVSFLCSVLEAVLLSVSTPYLASLERSQPELATQLRAMKADVDRPLTAILTLNTIAHTIGAAGAGAQATVVFGSEWIGLFSAVLTVLILILSEIIPKTLGAVYWRSLTKWTVRILRILLVPPFGWLVGSMQVITRLLKRGATPHTVSKEEVAALARIGARDGAIDPAETRVLENVFRLGKLEIQDIMTPRTVMLSLQASQTVGDVIPCTATGDEEVLAFSRIPVWGATPDDVVGCVLKSELLLRAARDEHHVEVGSLARKMLLAPRSLSVADLFDRLLDEREHIALVHDEYGGVAGVVTMEDVLETLLGMEIVDEADTTEDLQELARSRWEERRKRTDLEEIG